MFTSVLDRRRYPLFTRRRGILLGTLLMLAVTASLVSPRTLAYSYWIVSAGFLVAAVVERFVDLRQLRLGPVAIYLGAFLLYALLSSAWAVRSDIALEKASVALLVAATTFAIVPLIVKETRANLLHMGEGVCLGLFIGLLYLLVELLTDQSIKLWLFRSLGLGPGDLNPPGHFKWDGTFLVRISSDDLTRNITPAALFLWPAAMVIRATWAEWRLAGTASLVLLTATVVLISSHESSKLALVVGLGAFGLAHLSRLWAGRIAMVAWVFACLAVVPVALLAHRLDLHNSPWLQKSAKHRIIIWDFTAGKVLESPWIGTGANMTYVLGPEIERDTPHLPGEMLQRTLSIHSHSVYLQTWYELGMFGAVLLTVAGSSILSAIRSLAPPLQAYAYATFGSAAAMAAASYGMWQVWFMAAFGLCAVLFWIGASVLSRG